MPDLKWLSCESQPPAPGQYLTRRDVKVTPGKYGLRSIRAVILPARFDGEKWNLPVQPQYYRPMPEKNYA